MARHTDVRYTLTGTLLCRTPLHVGGFGDDPDTDLPLARDGLNRCYVPGTSLAGALRQWCHAAFGHEAVSAVWGFQKDDEGHASFVAVDDLFVPDDKLIPEVRDGVGIDRRSGAAAEHIKYDRAVLPRGTVLTGFALTADVAAGDAPRALAMLAGLRDALSAGFVRLGAAKTRGLGKVQLLDNAKLTRIETNTWAGAFRLLEGAADPVPDAEVAAAHRVCPARPRPRLEVAIDWKPDGPLMVKAGYDGIAVDMLPLVSGTTDGQVAPVLPGSSIKGTLRTRAEQIVCTLLDISVDRDPKTADNPRKRFLDDLLVPLVDELFGTRGGADARAGNARVRGRYRHGTRDESRLGLGALSAEDCYATKNVPAARWVEVTTAGERQLRDKTLASEAELRRALDNAGLGDWQQAFHVAIDRWTGGAAESFLYTVLEPHAVAWEPIRLTVDLDRTPAAGVALLLFVLRDLAEGRLPLGFAVNRGMGAVKDVKVTVTPHDAPVYGTDPFLLGALPPTVRDHLNGQWVAWLDQAPAPEVHS